MTVVCLTGSTLYFTPYLHDGNIPNWIPIHTYVKRNDNVRSCDATAAKVLT